MSKVMKKVSKFSLAQLKYYAFQLRKNYQLPYKLVYYIDQLNNESDKTLVKWLSDQSEHYLRVKGYYKKFPDIEKVYNSQIVKDYCEIWVRC